jgi:hypothetical protein
MPETLDSFAPPHYVITLPGTTSKPWPTDIRLEPLVPSSRLGRSRQTIFTNGGPNPWAQPSTLDIGKGILIVNTGFDSVSALQVLYGAGQTPTGDNTPLGLNLSNFKALQLNFAGIATSSNLLVNLAVKARSSASTYDSEQSLPLSVNPFAATFAFSSFNKPPLEPFDPSAIDGVSILIQGGGTITFGITSFQAVP